MNKLLDQNPKLKNLLYKIFSFLCLYFAVDSLLYVIFFYEYAIIMFFHSIFTFGFLYFAWKLYILAKNEIEEEKNRRSSD